MMMMMMMNLYHRVKMRKVGVKVREMVYVVDKRRC